MRWPWVSFQCRGVLLIWIRIGQGPTLAMGTGGGSLDIFTLVYHFSFLFPSLWETARYRLKYCLKGPLSPKQLTNQDSCSFQLVLRYVYACFMDRKEPRDLAVCMCNKDSLLSALATIDNCTEKHQNKQFKANKTIPHSLHIKSFEMPQLSLLLGNLINFPLPLFILLLFF